MGLVCAPAHARQQPGVVLPPQVVVVTHAYGKCAGVRFLTHGLKVHFACQSALLLNLSLLSMVMRADA